MKHEHKHHEHHKHHEMKHHSKHEHKPHDGMIDNRMVHDDHQQGIKRVLQRGHDKRDYCGHEGSMKGGWNHGKGESKGHWGRESSPLVPRKG